MVCSKLRHNLVSQHGFGVLVFMVGHRKALKYVTWNEVYIYFLKIQIYATFTTQLLILIPIAAIEINILSSTVNCYLHRIFPPFFSKKDSVATIHVGIDNFFWSGKVLFSKNCQCFLQIALHDLEPRLKSCRNPQGVF